MTGPRIAIGGILTECNHLGGVPIDMAVYESSELYRGEQVLQLQHSVVGGMLERLAAAQAEPLPLLYAAACAGGPIAASCYQALRDELIERLQQHMPVDGVLLPLHGSALADGEDDPEGDILQRVRQLVGPQTPIVATLDLHAHVTERMVSHADALLAWETYPHRDQFPTGARGAQLLLETISGQVRPTMAMAKAPVITSAIHGSTNDGDPFAELMAQTKQLEQRNDVLSTSLFLIHPYMDVEQMGSGGLVITNNDLPLAVDLASELASAYWDRRHDLEPHTYRVRDAIDKGRAVNGGPVLLVETADCCGGGAAGDSVAALRELVAANLDDLSLAPLVDPAAAAQCHRAGVGADVTLQLGHQLDPRWGEPLDVTGRVERLSDGRFTYSGGQWEGHQESMGPTAVLAVGSVRVLIMSRATYDWADEQWQAVGLDARQAKFLVVKNPMNYRQTFAPLARACFVLDTPGPTPASLKHVKFEKLQRPYFPADDEIPDFQPRILT